jgi:diamine N-acetyltransferase
MILEDERIRLRAVEPDDLELLYAWENDVTLWDVGNTRQPYSRFALKEYIAQCDRNIYEACQLRLMITDKHSSQTIGTVDLFDFDVHHSRIAFGLYVHASFQGCGFATAALRLIESYVFEFLTINQLYCHIAASNTASINMFTKENYTQNAILKKWIKVQGGFEDVVVFQLFNPLLKL